MKWHNPASYPFTFDLELTCLYAYTDAVEEREQNDIDRGWTQNLNEVTRVIAQIIESLIVRLRFRESKINFFSDGEKIVLHDGQEIVEYYHSVCSERNTEQGKMYADL